MIQVVMEREFDPGLDVDRLTHLARSSVSANMQKQVVWRESLLADNGQRLICRFEAPDVASVRRCTSDTDETVSLWGGTLHDTGRDGEGNVVVARRFDDPVTVESLQAIEDAAAWCLEQYKVTFLRTFFSDDKRRMLCLYTAPDAESVRLAQREAGMPVESVWACRELQHD